MRDFSIDDLLEFRDDIPDWLRPHISNTCSCGSYLVSNANLTRTRCTNPYCPYHIAARIEWLANEMSVPGWGFKTALEIVQQNDMDSHLRILPIWFGLEKPKALLWKVAYYAQIYGRKGEWEGIFKKYKSFDEYFKTERYPDPLAKANEEYLKWCEQFFNVQPPNVSKMEINIWMTGSFPGYSSRSLFIDGLNEKYGDVVRVRDNKHKQSGTSYLVKPTTAADRSKTSDALRLGIPIVTPEEFSEIVAQIYYVNRN